MCSIFTLHHVSMNYRCITTSTDTTSPPLSISQEYACEGATAFKVKDHRDNTPPMGQRRKDSYD